jgi:acyl carrier protein
MDRLALDCEEAMTAYTQESLFMKVLDIIAENLESGSEILPTSDLINDLHADSLDILNIILAIEKELDVTLENPQIAECRTPEQIVSLLWLQLPHPAATAELSFYAKARA